MREEALSQGLSRRACKGVQRECVPCASQDGALLHSDPSVEQKLGCYQDLWILLRAARNVQRDEPRDSMPGTFS